MDAKTLEAANEIAAKIDTAKAHLVTISLATGNATDDYGTICPHPDRKIPIRSEHINAALLLEEESTKSDLKKLRKEFEEL